MTQNTKQMMFFKDISGKKVVADFNGGDVSSDGGLLFLREVEAQTGIIKSIVNALTDKRHPGYIKHQLNHLFTQRVFQIASAYEDANDSDTLRDDPIMKIACEKQDSSLASQPTMSRFENGFSRTDLLRIARAFLHHFIKSYKKKPKAILLDFDDTPDPTHGNQQLSFFNGYHGTYCFMPMHIYEGASGKLITTILRTGKRPSGKEIKMILKHLVKELRDVWPDVEILLRADSHYSCPEVFEFCKKNNIQFVLGLTGRPTMLKQVQSLLDRGKELYALNDKPVKLYKELEYQADSWKNPQRIICKIEYTEKGQNIRFIVTSLANNNIRMIYETIYCGRGAMELMIKEHKVYLRSDKTSCSSFKANQFRLFLHSIAYVLLHALREKHLKNTQFAKAQFDTIRLKILKIGVRVVRLSTKTKIHMPTSYAYQADLIKIWQSCVT